MYRTLAMFFLSAVLCLAQTKFDPSEHWKPLIGQDLSGWKALDTSTPNDWAIMQSVALDPTNSRLFLLGPLTSGGQAILINGKTGKTVNIVTAEGYGDVEVYTEFMIAQGSNSGIYFQGLYEVQILDSFGVKQIDFHDCGGIYARYIDSKVVGGTTPRVNASRAPGQWQNFRIWFRAPRFSASGQKTENGRFLKVEHNGVIIHENVEVDGPTRASMTAPEGPTGPLMLQGTHGPVAFRSMYIRPLPQ